MHAFDKISGDWRLTRRLMVVGVFLISGCVAQPGWQDFSSQEHIVRSGETLGMIGDRYGKDFRDLARWNNLGDGSLIYPGQRIRLTPSDGGVAAQQSARTSSAAPQQRIPVPADPSPSWGWPTSGKLVAGFSASPGSGSGLLIGGKEGQPVRAAASGRVVYSGGGLIGYGQLIILKHNDTYLSAYGYNASVLVKEGETIKKGQRIATMGEGPGLEPRLHFEIRRNGEPVDPRQYLPAR